MLRPWVIFLMREWERLLVVLVVVAASCHPAPAQSPLPEPSSTTAPQPSLASDHPTTIEGDPVLRVCRRPLPRWAGSRNWLLKFLNYVGVRHLHHSYISFPQDTVIPGVGSSFRTVGIHPVGAANKNKQPMLDQGTDNLNNGGECKVVRDATPQKLQRLIEEIAADTCYSCGKDYHNRVHSACYNNSNTYVYDLIKGAGMTPPKMKGVPGYRHHHTCHI